MGGFDLGSRRGYVARMDEERTEPAAGVSGGETPADGRFKKGHKPGTKKVGTLVAPQLLRDLRKVSAGKEELKSDSQKRLKKIFDDDPKLFYRMLSEQERVWSQERARLGERGSAPAAVHTDDAAPVLGESDEVLLSLIEELLEGYPK